MQKYAGTCKNDKMPLPRKIDFRGRPEFAGGNTNSREQSGMETGYTHKEQK